jgi:UDP-N-acetylglucosamine transferase subunit ALG13
VDLLILVTLGTQAEPFKRLLDAIENSNIKDEIVVQAGNTEYTSNKMKIMKFMSYQEMDELVNKADLIITHGGTGSIVEPLKKGKKIIGCARLQKYDEHVDNHQEELISAFVDKGYILEFKDGDNIDDIVEKAKNFVPNEYHSNTENFIKKLKEKIGN